MLLNHCLKRTCDFFRFPLSHGARAMLYPWRNRLKHDMPKAVLPPYQPVNIIHCETKSRRVKQLKSYKPDIGRWEAKLVMLPIKDGEEKSYCGIASNTNSCFKQYPNRSGEPWHTELIQPSPTASHRLYQPCFYFVVILSTVC